MSIETVDIVNRKLAEFERKNRTFRQLYEQTAYANPLLFAATGMITGIIISSLVNISLKVFILGSGSITVLFFFLVFLQYRYNLKSIIYISSLFMGICFALLGACRLELYRTPAAGDIRRFVDNDRTLATIKGVVISQPVTYKRSWVFGELGYTDPPSGFLLRLKQVKTENGFAEVNGKIKVYAKEPVIHVTPGDYVRIHCWLEHLREPSNPGQFNYAEFMKRKNVYITADVKSHNAIKVISSPESSLPLKIKYEIISRINNILFSSEPSKDPHRGVLAALLLGNRSEIDKETYADFRKTGLLHFISLSGLHMGILIASVWFICRRIGFLEKATAAICLAVILLFCITVPLRSATFRAAIIAAMFCFACFFSRKPSPFNTLSLAAVILILIRPTCVFEPGWQLSFACVTGILLFSERIKNFLLAPREKISPPDKLKIFIRKTTAIPIELLAVGLSAWLGAAGILLYHFHTLTPFAPLWTVIVFPFIALILITGYIKIAIGLIIPTTAYLLGLVIQLLTDVLLHLIRLISSLDIGEILFGRIHPALIIFYYFTILLFVFAPFIKLRIRKPLVVSAVPILLAGAFIAKRENTHFSGLRLDCLSVGHGQVVIARVPESKTILFDGGSLSYKDIGTKIILPFLKCNGIARLDSIILSHCDIDHINGIPEVCSRFETAQIFAGTTFFDDSESYSETLLRRHLEKMNLTVSPIPEKLPGGGETHIQQLKPLSGNTLAVENFTDNNRSAVLLIEFAERTILLCGDIEQTVQRRLINSYPNLQPDVVIAAHHGSKNSLYRNFLKKLSPDYVICSCGYSDYTNNRVIDEENTDANIIYTPTSGAVSVVIDRQGKIQIECFKSRQ